MQKARPRPNESACGRAGESYVLTSAFRPIYVGQPVACPLISAPPFANTMSISLLAQSTQPTQATLSADHVLGPYIYVFYAAFIVSFIFTPVMRWVAVYYGIIDRPDATRKMHKSPVAYLGGVAIFLGWLAGITIACFAALHYWDPAWGVVQRVHIPVSIIIGSSIIVALGLWDDLKSVHPRVKILGQLVAGGALLVEKIGRGSTMPLLAPINLRLEHALGVTLPLWVYIFTGCCLTLAMVVFCCNAVNLMDGLDGLAGGVISIIGMGFLFLVVYMAMIAGPTDVQGGGLRIVLALALLGAVMAFVPHNFNPASIFMGDTGSMFLGYASAILIVMMAELDTRWLLAAMVMFALPVLDTSLAFARRWVNRRPVFMADRMHFHHQLVMRGLTVRKTVIVSYILSIAFVALGSAIIFMRTRYAVAIYLVVLGWIVVAAYKMGMVHEKPAVVSGPGGTAFGSDAASATGPIDSSSVLEVRESEKRDLKTPPPPPQPPGAAA
ncbi:hypothetical protein BH09PLA1_BH09PLA1_06860 [soil metagenome]